LNRCCAYVSDLCVPTIFANESVRNNTNKKKAKNQIE
jgi:hypothetical protein